MTDQVTDFMKDWDAKQNQRLRVALANRKLLHTILTGLGVIRVTCTYSGYGDSGGIEELEVFGGTDGPEALDAALEQNVSFLAPMLPGAYAEGTIKNALQEMFWNLLMSTHPGFENNEGGQGEFEWLLPEDELKLDHNENVIETISSSDSF
jgi:hypothetical protein